MRLCLYTSNKPHYFHLTGADKYQLPLQGSQQLKSHLLLLLQRGIEGVKCKNLSRCKLELMNKKISILLNLAHALDHLFLLIFATAVLKVSHDLGVKRWEDLMPYASGMFFLFGIASYPAGKLAELWGRRQMMLIFFAGLSGAGLIVALSQTPLQLAIGLALIGLFASIYHPVGIPMLLQNTNKPGLVIGINGLIGNFGVAIASILTSFLVAKWGWRTAFIGPAVIAAILGLAFAIFSSKVTATPVQLKLNQQNNSNNSVKQVFLIMTITSATGSLLFNFTTNGNTQVLTERLSTILNNPTQIGSLLFVVYLMASFSQLAVGKLLDKVNLKKLYWWIVALQIPILILATHASGWFFYLILVALMIFIFGAIPFTDAILTHYVNDSMRSRVMGMRLAVSFSISSIAVWLLGPLVKAGGFTSLFMIMAGIALITLMAISFLPSDHNKLNHN